MPFLALAVDAADKVVTIIPHVATVSHNPLPEWLRCAPIGTPGYTWFPAAMILLLCIMAWLVFGYTPGHVGGNGDRDLREH